MRDFISEFLDAKSIEKGASLNTLDAYKRDLNEFFKILKNKKVEDIDKEDIVFYLNNLNKLNNSPKTISRKNSCLREFFKFLITEKVITNNPTNTLHNPKLDKSLPSFLTLKEIEQICDTARNSNSFSLKRVGVMVKLMYSSGIRVSELVSLPEKAINNEQKQILIHGKGNKERVVPINKETIDEVKNYLKYRDEFIGNGKNNWLFPSLTSLSGHITRDGFFKALKKLAIQTGISPSKVFPHVLRHSFATSLVNNNADLRSIQKMLGHENVVTTEIYTHITTQKLVDEVKTRHPLARKKDIKI